MAQYGPSGSMLSHSPVLGGGESEKAGTRVVAGAGLEECLRDTIDEAPDCLGAVAAGGPKTTSLDLLGGVGLRTVIW